jgi:hypothetical protein
MIAIDLLAIAVMTFGLYFPRHRRRDLVVAYLVVNVGVLAISTILGSSAVGLGLGLGLFGVLSIIRLRSSELAQNEVAYYFAALALGLLAGLATPGWVSIGLMALILAALAVGDTPALFRRYRHQTMVLDTAYTDEVALQAELERMLGGRLHRVTIQHVDTVNDTTLVDVRYEAAGRVAVKPRVETTEASR